MAEEPALCLTELAALLLSTCDVEESLRDIVDVASGTLPGGPLAGITLVRDGGAMTVASTGALNLCADPHSDPPTRFRGGSEGNGRPGA
ncbi:hypothetical protein [Nocardia sp. IFM 10818]